MGLNVVGIWQRGLLQPAFPDTEITDDTILVVVGTPTQMDLLNKPLETPSQSEESLTLIIGAGTVGNACTRALKNKGHLVHILERDGNMLDRGKSVADQVYIGDANDRESLMKAGLENAQSVILTSKDDAVTCTSPSTAGDSNQICASPAVLPITGTLQLFTALARTSRSATHHFAQRL